VKELNELLNTAELNRNIANGYISLCIHLDNNGLAILNYTQKRNLQVIGQR
jgi:hypothetical protein